MKMTLMPPNFERVSCCWNCSNSDYEIKSWELIVWCGLYSMDVDPDNTCEQYKEEMI